MGADADVLNDRDFRLLLLASLSSPLGASVVSPILEGLTRPFGVSEARIGLLMAAFTAPAILCIPLVGILADRVGRKPVLTAGLALFGLTGLAVPLTTDFELVLLLRALQGIGYTGIGPVLITSVGDLFEGPAEATAQGLRFTTVGASLTVFPLVSGLLVGIAWQYPFLLYGVAVPTAVAVALLLDEPLRQDSDPPARDADMEPSETEPTGTLTALVSLVRQPGVAAILAGRAVPSFIWFAFLTYNSIIVVQLLDGSAPAAGLAVAAASLASALGTTQVGRLTARAGSRGPPLLGSLVITAVGLAGFALAPSVPVALGASIVIGAGFGVVLTLYRSSLTALADTHTRGSLVSLGETVGRIGSTVAPIAMGAGVTTLGAQVGFGPGVRIVVVAVAFGALIGGVGLLAVGTIGADTGWETSDQDPVPDGND